VDPPAEVAVYLGLRPLAGATAGRAVLHGASTGIAVALTVTGTAWLAWSLWQAWLAPAAT
jgi:hypothetical protein